MSNTTEGACRKVLTMDLIHQTLDCLAYPCMGLERVNEPSKNTALINLRSETMTWLIHLANVHIFNCYMIRTPASCAMGNH